MKFHNFAAAALLLASGSALAYAPEDKMSKSDLVTVADKGAELGIYKDYGDAKDAMVADEEAVIVPAAATTWEAKDPMVASDPDLDLAETSIDDSVPAEPAGVRIAAAEPTPRPASQNYPACRPGPGDDSCIQLYEPGVETALASWTAPTGGVAEPGEAMAAATTTESLNAESLALASAQVDAIRADGTALASAETDEPAVPMSRRPRSWR